MKSGKLVGTLSLGGVRVAKRKTEVDAAKDRIKAYKSLLRKEDNEERKKILKQWITLQEDLIKLHKLARRS